MNFSWLSKAIEGGKFDGKFAEKNCGPAMKAKGPKFQELFGAFFATKNQNPNRFLMPTKKRRSAAGEIGGFSSDTEMESREVN